MNLWTLEVCKGDSCITGLRDKESLFAPSYLEYDNTVLIVVRVLIELNSFILALISFKVQIVYFFIDINMLFRTGFCSILVEEPALTTPAIGCRRREKQKPQYA